MESGITRDAWLKALAEAGCNEDEDDRAAVSINEFAAMLGLQRETAKRRLLLLESAGRATKTQKRCHYESGRTVRVIAYRLVAP